MAKKRDMELPPDTTIEEAHKQLWAQLHDGVVCPVCTQFCKKYSRPIRAGMVMGLGVLAAFDNDNPGEWCHVESEIKERRPSIRGGDWCKLRFWKMIEPIPEPDSLLTGPADDVVENPRNGMWRITQLGRDFLAGDTTVPERAIVFNNTCYGFSGERLDVAEIMQRGGFQYGDIMP